jgi:hypothetical protein
LVCFEKNQFIEWLAMARRADLAMKSICSPSHSTSRSRRGSALLVKAERHRPREARLKMVADAKQATSAVV